MESLRSATAFPEEEMKVLRGTSRNVNVGTDVSPDFYGWVFTSRPTWPWVPHDAEEKSLIKGLQKGVPRRRRGPFARGEVDQGGSAPDSEHPRSARVGGRMALVGDCGGLRHQELRKVHLFSPLKSGGCGGPSRLVAASGNGNDNPYGERSRRFI